MVPFQWCKVRLGVWCLQCSIHDPWRDR